MNRKLAGVMEEVQLSRALLILCCLAVALTFSQTSLAQIQPGEMKMIPAGEKEDITGVVLKRYGDLLLVRRSEQRDTIVVLTDITSIKTSKKGVFRGGKEHGMTSIIQGLILEVDGVGDSQGRLVAKDIRFKEEDLKAAITAAVRVDSVEKTVAAMQQNTAAPQQSVPANQQSEASKQAIDATNTRMSSLDDWELVRTVEVFFALNSAALSAESKATLDALGARSYTAKNYQVEVAGFADSTGDPDKNIALSQRRADAVVQYLVSKYNVPLRRISTPIGYGVAAAADKSKQSADKDRRVDIRILVNKAMQTN
jgi:outer membrane protein OmpA-like peptidoglycan-associated protein